jgi:hypothetical protein
MEYVPLKSFIKLSGTLHLGFSMNRSKAEEPPSQI